MNCHVPVEKRKIFAPIDCESLRKPASLSLKYHGPARLIIVRHAYRLDEADESWPARALRPQDSPLAPLGVRQAQAIGATLARRDAALLSDGVPLDGDEMTDPVSKGAGLNSMFTWLKDSLDERPRINTVKYADAFRL